MDLLVANGHIYPNADLNDWGTSYRQRLLLFHNVKNKFYEVASGRSLPSQSDFRVHFGLDTATKIDKLEVRWANGKTESYAINSVDQIITLEQSKGVKK